MSFGGLGSYDILQMQREAERIQALNENEMYGGKVTGGFTPLGAGRGVIGAGNVSMLGSGGGTPISYGGGGITSSVQSPGYLPLNNTQAQTDPWSAHRTEAGTQLAAQMGNDPSNFYRDKLQAMSSGEFTPDDPSYKFRFEQGQQAVERSLAAKGFLNSGNAAIELQNYGQQAASQEYGAQFNRMLQGLSGVSAQHDTQMKQLMTMAGVGLDPTSSAKLNLETQKTNNDLYGMGLQASTARYVADVGAAASRANAQTQAAASVQGARIGSYASDLNAMANAGALAYGMSQNTAQESALSSALFLNSNSNNNTMWVV